MNHPLQDEIKLMLEKALPQDLRTILRPKMGDHLPPDNRELKAAALKWITQPQLTQSLLLANRHQLAPARKVARPATHAAPCTTAAATVTAAAATATATVTLAAGTATLAATCPGVAATAQVACPATNPPCTPHA